MGGRVDGPGKARTRHHHPHRRDMHSRHTTGRHENKIEAAGWRRERGLYFLSGSSGATAEFVGSVFCPACPPSCWTWVPRVYSLRPASVGLGWAWAGPRRAACVRDLIYSFTSLASMYRTIPCIRPEPRAGGPAKPSPAQAPPIAGGGRRVSTG